MTVDLNGLSKVNDRLSRAREAYHEALIVERETEVLCLLYPRYSMPPHQVQDARQRVRQTAEAYEEALEAFSQFTLKRTCASSA
jgi:hypothetical protein